MILFLIFDVDSYFLTNWPPLLFATIAVATILFATIATKADFELSFYEIYKQDFFLKRCLKNGPSGRPAYINLDFRQIMKCKM